MISNRPMVPMLTHVDNLGDINLDMTTQEQLLETISHNTELAKDKLSIIETNTYQLERIAVSAENNESNTSSIKTSSSNTATATSSLNSAVGTTSDESTSNTVIGLLKSIANKL